MAGEKDDLAVTDIPQAPPPANASPSPTQPTHHGWRKLFQWTVGIIGSGALISGAVGALYHWGQTDERVNCATEKTKLVNLEKEKEDFETVRKDLEARFDRIRSETEQFKEAMQQQRIADQQKIIAMSESLNARDGQIAVLNERLHRCDREFENFTEAKKQYEETLHPWMRIDPEVQQQRTDERGKQLAADRKTYEICIARRLDP